MFLENTHKVIKTFPEQGFKYVLYISDKKECDDIKSGLFKPDADLLAYGECKTMDIDTATAVLPDPVFIHNLLTNKVENTHHCFCSEKLGIKQLIGHKTPMNSWDCLLISLGNPEYCVIVQEKLEKDD